MAYQAIEALSIPLRLQLSEQRGFAEAQKH